LTPDGTALHLYVLKDDRIEAAIMNCGARIVSIRTPDRYGKMADVVLSYSGSDHYFADISAYPGAVVGRYANRIAAGQFSLGIAISGGHNERAAFPFAFLSRSPFPSSRKLQ
jgi:aldose 1-epimerase